MSKYILSPRAAEDLEDIFEFISYDSSVNARRVIQRLNHAFRGLARWPMSGHLRDDLTSRPVRFVTVSGYCIIYTFDRKPIQILRVVHGSRNIMALLERQE